MRCVGASDCGARGGSFDVDCGDSGCGDSGISCVAAPLTSSVERGCSTPRVAPHISSVCRAKSGSSGSVSYLLRFSDMMFSKDDGRQTMDDGQVFPIVYRLLSIVRFSCTNHTCVGFTTILLFDDAVFHPCPTSLALEQTKRAQGGRLRTQA